MATKSTPTKGQMADVTRTSLNFPMEYVRKASCFFVEQLTPVKQESPWKYAAKLFELSKHVFQYLYQPYKYVMQICRRENFQSIVT
jgi:hypothetical protein